MATVKQKNLLEEKKTAKILLNPVINTGKKYFIFVGFLVFLVILAGIAYLTQLSEGLVVTGLRDRISWGAYVANFVFFIGISHAGTFISAVLRVTDAQWRNPITRLGELLTAFGLLIGGAMVLIDLGRIDRILLVIIQGRLQSPILWDVLALTMYLSGSILYLYLALIPDFAIMRDHLGENANWLKRRLWRILALGWEGTERQHKRLNRGIGIMAWILIPVMVTVHTVVSYTVGGIMLRPGWRSTIFGPYFVVGALFSGTAAIITVMWIVRIVYPDFKKIITERHFRNLAVVLFVLSLGYFYFTFSEYIGTLYSNPTPEYELIERLLFGEYSLLFWFAIIGGIIIPGVIIFLTRARSIRWLVFATILINLGMWTKRYVIIVPAMARPWIAGPWATYAPSLIEITIIIGSFAALILGVTLAAKFFPLAPLWEILEEEEHRKRRIEAGIKPIPTFADLTFPLPQSVHRMEEEIDKELLNLGLPSSETFRRERFEPVVESRFESVTGTVPLTEPLVEGKESLFSSLKLRVQKVIFEQDTTGRPIARIFPISGSVKEITVNFAQNKAIMTGCLKNMFFPTKTFEMIIDKSPSQPSTDDPWKNISLIGDKKIIMAIKLQIEIASIMISLNKAQVKVDSPVKGNICIHVTCNESEKDITNAYLLIKDLESFIVNFPTS